MNILFICLGNICRSTMAEQIFLHMAEERGLTVSADSAATSREEIGNPMYPPAARKLREKGVPVGSHRARQLTKDDYGRFDLLLCMEERNRRDALAILGSDPEGKLRLLLPGETIADPWYTDDFETAYRELVRGCDLLLKEAEKHA